MTFHPWRGPRYADDGFLHRRLLIVGEAHYDTWCGVQHNDEELSPTFTQKCVHEDALRGRLRFWNTVRYRLGGGSPDFWDKVAFCNFIQTPVHGGPRARPQASQWSAARGLFRGVLDVLRPQRVLFTALELWGNVCRDDALSNICVNEQTLPLEFFRLPDGQAAFTTRMPHPSSSQCKKALSPALRVFIENEWDVNRP